MNISLNKSMLICEAFRNCLIDGGDMCIHRTGHKHQGSCDKPCNSLYCRHTKEVEEIENKPK